MQAKLRSLFIGEGGAFVQQRRVEQILPARNSGRNNLRDSLRYGIGNVHQVITLSVGLRYQTPIAGALTVSDSGIPATDIAAGRQYVRC